MNVEENREFVVLVDAHDREIGVCGKLEAHLRGELHRALSVVVVNGRGEWLLHRRAATKYHSPGLWTNTCCSHPRPGEAPLAFIGKGVNGARRWISLGVFNFQPSELAKFATLLYAADYMVRKMEVIQYIPVDISTASETTTID